ncbi:MAG: ArsR/SmtB family transcription factor [Spirochaetales bacterium]
MAGTARSTGTDTLDALKALADETRLRIVNILEQADELCACEIEAVLDLNQSNASRHLSRLRGAGIAVASRDGHWVHYAFAWSSPHVGLTRGVLESLRAENARFRADLERLRAYRGSGQSCHTVEAWRATTSGRPDPRV